LPAPACVIANSPYADMAAASPSLDDPRRNQGFQNRAIIEQLQAAYLGGADPRDGRHSPVYRDLSGLPPLLVQVGGLDNLHDDAVRLAAQARACGVEVAYTDYPLSEHIWIVFKPADKDSQARHAHEEIRDFIRARVGPVAEDAATAPHLDNGWK
jgi:epsilon-lactone hydrolase